MGIEQCIESPISLYIPISSLSYLLLADLLKAFCLLTNSFCTSPNQLVVDLKSSSSLPAHPARDKVKLPSLPNYLGCGLVKTLLRLLS